MGRGIKMKILDKIRQIITKKKEVNKKPLIAKEKDANKVERNKWGFPINKNPPAFFRDRK
jgi:hypothetical protein